MGRVIFQRETYDNVQSLQFVNDSLFIVFTDGSNKTRVYKLVHELNSPKGKKDRIKIISEKEIKINTLIVANSGLIQGDIKQLSSASSCVVTGKVEKCLTSAYTEICKDLKEAKGIYEKQKKSCENIYTYENRRKIMRLEGSFDTVLLTNQGTLEVVLSHAHIYNCQMGNKALIDGNVQSVETKGKKLVVGSIEG